MPVRNSFQAWPENSFRPGWLEIEFQPARAEIHFQARPEVNFQARPEIEFPIVILLIILPPFCNNIYEYDLV